MSRENLRINGIVRNGNLSDGIPGNCEELINVQNEDGILKIVKDKQEVSVNIPYKDIIIHDVENTRNYIGKDSAGYVWFDPYTGEILQRLYESVDNLDNIHIATLNNMVIISDKNIVANTIYLFSNGRYDIFMEKDSLNIPLSITHEEFIPTGQVNENLTTDSFLVTTSNEESIKNFKSSLIKFLNDNPRYVLGYYLIGINITLWDNTETRLTNLHPFFPAKMPLEEDGGLKTHTILSSGGGGDNYHYFRCSLAGFLKVHAYTIHSFDVSKFKKIIKSINVYISEPLSLFHFSPDKMVIPFDTLATYINYYPVQLTESNLENQLLYKYKSYNIEMLSSDISEEIEFGIERLPTNKTLQVDAGLITRAGQMNLYNNRLHFFDSIAKLDLTNGYYIKEDSNAALLEYTADVIIYIRNTTGDDLKIKLSNVKFKSITSLEPYYTKLDHCIIVQDSRAYKVVFTRPGYYAEVLLQSSPRYNYSYAYFPILSFTEGNQYDDVTADDTYSEFNAINVTAQNNPMIFPVEHSYLFDGHITDIATATESISQTQIGQYPLYVFTTKGIYTLEQGSGTVLYSNQILINPDKCYNHVTQTRNGVVYIANGNVYILSGRNTLNITLPINGPLDTDIRGSKAYTQCCLNDHLYNVSEMISQVEFKEYLKSAKLIYSSYKDELIVSNPAYKYSYVFSFIYKTWHKISESLRAVGDNIIQRVVFTPYSEPVAAKGEIIVSNAVVVPAHTFKAVQRAIYSGSDFQSGNMERYALLIDGEQISSIYIRYPARLALIIALLCKDIPYIDCMYDGASHFIYSNTAFSKGATINLIQSDTGYSIFEATLEDWTNVASIPDKAIGDIITINTSEGATSSRAIIDGDSVVSMAALLSDSINSASAKLGISSSSELNKIALTAAKAGAAGNEILLSIDAGNYVSMYHSKMSGGKDMAFEQADYSRLIDYTKEKDITKVIHIQTRPISFAQAYSIIRRLILSCKATISAENNLSMYLFASNDLTNWQCVAASQKSDVTLDHIRLQRSARAYKHYIIIIGGKVSTTTELSFLSLDVETRFDNKIR